MAGGALGGVFGAALRLFPWYKESLVHTPFYGTESIFADALGGDVHRAVRVRLVGFGEEAEGIGDREGSVSGGPG